MKKIESNRKQRKERYISAKNLMRQYPTCAYNGDFYCNHEYDPEYPWVWVDFRFFHSQRKMYYAVAMVTAEYHALGQAEEKSWEHTYNCCPITEDEPTSIFDALPNGKYKFGLTKVEENRNEVYKCFLKELIKVPYIVQPSIELKDYGSGVVGVVTTVNKEHIDEHAIREFIAFFRSLGEPITPGWSWKGDAVEVIPQKIYTRRSGTEASE